MKMHVKMRAYAVAQLSALLFCACQSTDPGTAKEWNGVARRSCGPADGPALEVLIDSLPLDCASTRTAAVRFYEPGLVLDSLPPMTVITSEPLVACDGSSDPVAVYTRLELTERDSIGITVNYRRIRNHPCPPSVIPPDTLEVTTRLKICREAPRPMCG
jgi:hypothetical protein